MIRNVFLKDNRAKSIFLYKTTSPIKVLIDLCGTSYIPIRVKRSLRDVEAEMFHNRGCIEYRG